MTGTNGEVILSAKAVDFGYHSRKKFIENFDLSLKRCEFTGIIGPNGSGKTTIFKLLTNLLKAEAGEICLNNQNIQSISSKKRAQMMAILPQTYEFNLPFSVREVISMGRLPHLNMLQAVKQADLDVINRAAEETGVLELFDKKFSELSGGERQRCLITSSLAQESEILFLDEPTAALDMGYSIQIMRYLKTLQKQKSISVVVISHDIELISRFVDRLIVMQNGKIIADGAAKDIVNTDLIKQCYNIDTNIINGKYDDLLISYRT